MIENNLVYGDPALEIPRNLSFGKYVIDNLKENSISGDKVVMVNGETHEQTTNGQILRKIVDIGNGLKHMGLASGDVVALCSESCCDYIAATVAALSVGATVTAVNFKYTNDEVKHALSISKPKLVFCSKAALETKLGILREVTCVEYIVQLDGAVTAQDVLPLAAIKVEGKTEDYEPEKVRDIDDTAFILYSSGTTGVPKGVMLTHHNVIYGSGIFNFAGNNKGNVLTVVPWYHVYGLLTTIQYIVSGNRVIFLKQFNTDKYLATIEKYQITEILAVPPIVFALAKSHLVHNYDLSSVRYIWSASAPLSADIISSAAKNLPNVKGIFQSYGMTETAVTVMKERESVGEFKKGGSCGVPLRGVMVKVVDIVTQEKLGVDRQGEICLKSPTLMKGYVNDEAATREMFDEEGFIKTGDVGYYDNDGCFYIVDKCKEIIKYKGQQVAPAVVESVIMEHEAVADCGVVGAPDELAGELPTAFVVKRPGAHLTEQELLNFTASKLSPASRLRGGVIYIEEIPRNGSGKIMRRELKNKLQH